MALKRIIAPVDAGVSSDGTSITIKDTTGAYNASTNLYGFGTPNPAVADFNSLITIVSYLDGSSTTLLDFNVSEVHDFLSGTYNLVLTSLMALGITSAYPFRDGSVKITSYAGMSQVTVQGLSGDSFITGTGLDDFVTADSIIDGANNVYQIDTAQSNSDTQIYLTTPIRTAITLATPAYQATTWVLVTSELSCKLTAAVAAMAGEGSEDDNAANLCDILVKKFSADFEFVAKDYAGADLTVNMAINLLNRLYHG